MDKIVNLSVEVAGVPFKNPLIAASGTFGFGEEYNELYDVGCLGGISSKGLTLHPKDGNDGIRVWETASGMMNSVGLQNPGVEAFIESGIAGMRRFGNVLIANMGGHSMEDYTTGASLLSDADIDMLELNISCPNVKSGGMAFGIKAEVAREVVSEVRKVCRKPLIVKLSPNAENIVEMALACEAAGADARLCRTLRRGHQTYRTADGPFRLQAGAYPRHRHRRHLYRRRCAGVRHGGRGRRADRHRQLQQPARRP